MELIPFPVVFAETSSFKDTYGGDEGLVVLECYLYRPEAPSSTVIVFSHPIGGGVYLPMVRALAKAGHHVLYANTRYRGNDTALIMEKCLVDLGAAIGHAKENLGYDKVVLGGWSGGGSLALFYQQQAISPAPLTATPAGDPVDLSGLVPGDAILLLAAHISRHGTLTEWIDPSILDENDPSRRNPELDLYDSGNPNQPPYTDDFLRRYRTAQIDRNRRITARVKSELAELRAAGRPNDECAFVVHGTMADPCWLDPSIDANDRTPGRCYLGDPQVVNNSPVGLARFTSLRSWLSQWSYDDARADGITCGAAVAVPTLVIGNTADDACTPSHTRRLFEAVAHPDKEMHEIVGASHYYTGEGAREHRAEAVGRCHDFLHARGF